MRVIVACVGRAKNTPEQELCDTYLARARAIGPKLGFSRIDLCIADTARHPTPQTRKHEEAKRLAKHIPQGAFCIVLDQRGVALSSESFAQELARRRDAGTRDIGFAIGGPDGLPQGFRQRADLCLSLGLQTWPHLLVRAMLAEQLYRAFSILAGHPYHRADVR